MKHKPTSGVFKLSQVTKRLEGEIFGEMLSGSLFFNNCRCPVRENSITTIKLDTVIFLCLNVHTHVIQKISMTDYLWSIQVMFIG